MASLELILILLAVVGALKLLADKLEVPHPALLVLGGAALAVIPGLPRPRLDPQVVFLVFVPPLLYWTALNTSWRDFRENLRSISLLSVGLVLATMAVIAVVAHALLPELTWAAAFVLGVIISPPDPVAVTAITHHLKVPRTVITVLAMWQMLAYLLEGLVFILIGLERSLIARTLGFLLRRGPTLSRLGESRPAPARLRSRARREGGRA
jgi:NhaP-type Na+/H+ or K+/H+ antiporter